MSGQIVPKRFGLKYSPKPAIALEYQKPEDDAGMAVLEVIIEQLSPRTCDVNGVVDALQKNHPSHLGPNMVSANQLQRLVSRLLFEGRDYLPKEYDTPTGTIVDEIQQTSPSPGLASPTKPSLQPKPAQGYDSDNSDGLSRGPTPAPTPEVQRQTRDLSDASSEEASNPGGPRGDRIDHLGGEKTNDATATFAGAPQASSNDVTGEPELSAATAASASAAAALLGDEKVREEEEEKEQEKVVLGEDESLLREQEDENEKRGRGRKENDTDQAHCGPREETKEEEETRGEAEASSLTGNSSGPHAQQQRNKLFELHEVLTKGDGFEDDDDETADDNEDGDRRRNSEGKVESLSPSPTSAITAAATTTTTTTTTLDKQSDRKSPRGEACLGENSSDKEELREEDGKEEEKDIPEIEEEDDDIPEDVKTEDFEEERSRSSSQAEREENGVKHPDDDGKELTSKYKDRQSVVDITHHTADNLADTVFSSGGDLAIAAEERIGATDKKGDHGNLPRLRFTEREAGGRGSVTPPEASLNTSPAMPTTPLTAATPVTITSPTSGKGDTTLSLSSNFAPSSILGPPSSPPLTAEGRTSPSSLTGLPLPPMGSARPRLGLLGSLPPVGGRNLPSLALTAAEGKAHNTGEEGEDAVKTGDIREPADEGSDFGVSSSLSPPLSSGLLLGGLSAVRSSSAEKKKGSASSVPDPSRIARTPAGSKGNTTNDDNNNSDTDTGEDERGLEGPAKLSLPVRAAVGGQEKKEEEAAANKKKEEEAAAFRARLGLGEDEESEDDEEEEDEEEEDGGGGGGVKVSEGFVHDRGNINHASSPPGSPKQHQGQEEEEAGQTPPPTNLFSKKGGVDSPVGGGDYFGDSDEANALEEISSIDEDISFEQESVNSGDGEGSDDYFS